MPFFFMHILVVWVLYVILFKCISVLVFVSIRGSRQWTGELPWSHHFHPQQRLTSLWLGVLQILLPPIGGEIRDNKVPHSPEKPSPPVHQPTVGSHFRLLGHSVSLLDDASIKSLYHTAYYVMVSCRFCQLDLNRHILRKRKSLSFF